MILIEVIFLLLALGLGGTALYLAKKKAGEKKSSRDYVPPPTKSGEPEQHIRTHGLAVFWHEIGAPRKVGDRAEVNMQSGNVGIYELRNVTPAPGTDWSWYDLEFIHYKDSAPRPADGPRSTVKN